MAELSLGSGDCGIPFFQAVQHNPEMLACVVFCTGILLSS